MTITKVAPSAVRRILWAEDEPDDIEGTPEYLCFIGHEVVNTVDFESTVEKLSSELFDLLVIDQRMPREGRKMDDAGARLVTSLAENAFGVLNADIPFVFVTASADWVLDCGIDVVSLPCFLGIEEKGDDLIGPLEDYLGGISRRADDHEHSLGQEGASDGGPDERPPVGDPPELCEEWHGVVLDVDNDTFRARLVATRGSFPDYEATLPRAAISERYQGHITEGATFTWSLKVHEDPSGQRVTTSHIVFREPPEVSDEEIADALERARARKGGDGHAGT
jgi:CheY-like chemotaxis protein